MEKTSSIYVAGHRGLVGSALVRALEKAGHKNLLTRTHAELDLTDRRAVDAFFAKEKPEYVFLAAARVGGIMANINHPVEFLEQNLEIEVNVIRAAHRHGAKKLLFLGSTCVYPRAAAQPMREDSLLTGPLEPTNEAYSLAKIAGIRLCQAYAKQHGSTFISVMPTNLYGPNDNFDPQASHVAAGLLRKFHDAKVGDAPTVTLWGTGKPKRELLYVDDCAQACLFLMEKYDSPDIINIGTGEDVSILELSAIVAKVVGYSGKIAFDASKPDGMPRKLVDVSKIRSLGWKHETDLEEGLRRTYDWFKEHHG